MNLRRGALDELHCPGCGSRFESSARFCPTCGLPLVPAAGPSEAPEASARHARARKVKPQLGEGPLVRVARGRNQAETEFIQELLLEEGVPSLVKRSPGFDVPDFLAAGPRDILVPTSGATTAREVLMQADLIGPEPAGSVIRPGRLLAGLILALLIGVLLVWLISLTIRA